MVNISIALLTENPIAFTPIPTIAAIFSSSFLAVRKSYKYANVSILARIFETILNVDNAVTVAVPELEAITTAVVVIAIMVNIEMAYRITFYIGITVQALAAFYGSCHSILIDKAFYRGIVVAGTHII